jgi:hypothetical protein
MTKKIAKISGLLATAVYFSVDMPTFWREKET